jgi:hypothetical protein
MPTADATFVKSVFAQLPTSTIQTLLERHPDLNPTAGLRPGRTFSRLRRPNKTQAPAPPPFPRTALQKRTEQPNFQRAFLLDLARALGFLVSIGSNGEERGSGHWYRPRHDLLVRRRVAARPRRDHRQRPGEPHHAVLCCLHRHRAAHRRRRQEPGRHESHQHRLRYVLQSIPSLAAQLLFSQMLNS